MQGRLSARPLRLLVKDMKGADELWMRGAFDQWHVSMKLRRLWPGSALSGIIQRHDGTQIW